jgi:hypothetical protein
MFTVRRLGIAGTLARTLVCTNMIESMISIARTTTRNVKRWCDEGDMRRRWCAAGLFEVERKFRRLREHAHPNSSPPFSVTPRASQPHAILTERRPRRMNTGTTTRGDFNSERDILRSHDGTVFARNRPVGGAEAGFVLSGSW